MSNGKLYLIPVPLGDSSIVSSFALDTTILHSIDFFVVENLKTARKYLKQLGFNKSFDEVIFSELNLRRQTYTNNEIVNELKKGKNIGLLSEAGCPGIADPGSDLIKVAHENTIQVIPLIGPCSIVLALMASGLNGQNFSFNGYLPKDLNQRIIKLKELEKNIFKTNQTQLFIETPYRNKHLIDSIINYCSGDLFFTVACDLTLSSEFIRTKSINDWKKNIPLIDNRPTLFLLGRPPILLQ